MVLGIAQLPKITKGIGSLKPLLHGELKNVFGKGKNIDITKDYFVDFKENVLPKKSSYSTPQHHLLKTKDKIIAENEQVFAGTKKKTNYPLTKDEVKEAKDYFGVRVGRTDQQINDRFKLSNFVNETFGNKKTMPPWLGDNVFETVFRKNNPDFSYKKIKAGTGPVAGKLELNELIKGLHKDGLIKPKAFENLNLWNKMRKEKSNTVYFQNNLDKMKGLYQKYSVKVPKAALSENPNAQSIENYSAFVKSFVEATGRPSYVDGKIARGFTNYVKEFNKQTGMKVPTPLEHQKLFSSTPIVSKIGSDKFSKIARVSAKSPELNRLMSDPKYSKMIKRVFGDRFERLHVLGESFEGRIKNKSQIKKIKNLLTRYEMIPEELVDKIRRPQFPGTKIQNQAHIDIEFPLIEALVKQFDILGYTFKPHGKVRGTGKLKAGGKWDPESTRTSPLTAAEKGELSFLDSIIKDAHNKLERSGLETTFYNPITKKLITFGKRPHSIFELRKRFLDPEDIYVKNRGGLINDNLTDTIAPERGPMPEGLPLLDPQESIDRQHFQVGGFASLFGKLSKVPRAVGRFGDIKKPPKIKPPTATEVAIGQATEDKPAMFLSTVNAIEDMPEVTMPANQWLGTIKNKPGVSATELDEFGLEALLTNIAKADPKRKLSKTELIETYAREMPKIDMDIAIAEPVSRGANDITKMLTRVRESRGHRQDLENLDVLSNDPRLLTALHQPPQDATGMKIRESIINIMRGTNKTVGVGDDATMTPLLKSSYGGQNAELHKGAHFKELWESAFPKIFHSTNEIVKRDHLSALRHLVSSDDVVNLAKSRNIPEEEAFSQLYQALNIFDRQIMTADVPIPFWTKKMLYRLGDMGEGRGFFYKSKKNPAHEGAQFIPGGSGYGEIKFYQNFETGAVRAQEGTYKSGHFSGEVFKGNTGNSPFGWGRFSERIDESGRKILLMEEIQSDLHQGVAQKGYKYAPRLDKHDVLAEVGEFAKQLDIKKQTLESTRLRKEAIKALPRIERESAANVIELRNIEKAIKKQIADVKKLQKKVEEQARLTGRTGQVYPDTAFKKSENYAKLFMQGLMKMAQDKGYDGIALSTGKMKKAHGKIPKGGDKFYDEIAVKAMKRMANKSGFRFSDTTIVDGNGFTWEKIPLIEMRDINTGMKIPGDATIPVYKKGGLVK